MAVAFDAGMELGAPGTNFLGRGEDKRSEIENRVLRSKLVNLILDWELAALTMDAQRYKSHAQMERESLRDAANTYRKCVAELNEIIAHSPAQAAKAHVAP
jgi:hypothetical protein